MSEGLRSTREEVNSKGEFSFDWLGTQLFSLENIGQGYTSDVPEKRKIWRSLWATHRDLRTFYLLAPVPALSNQTVCDGGSGQATPFRA